MKKRRIIVIISVAALLLALCYSYYKFECNEITDTYDWITLRNIYSELDDFLDSYEKEYQNRSIYEFEIKNNLLLKNILINCILMNGTYPYLLVLAL
jgi:hypothetical protein